MLTFNNDDRLLGCGIDAEHIERFSRWTGHGAEPPPFIFSPREIGYYRARSDCATGLCASFCCKEAVFKAIGNPYNFTDCELLWEPFKKRYTFLLSAALRREYSISDQKAVVDVKKSGECIVQVFLFGSRGY